jgi:hypothetical protein
MPFDKRAQKNRFTAWADAINGFLFLDFSDLTSQTAALLDQGMELAIDHVDLLSQLVQRFGGAAHIPYPVPKSGTLVWL